MSAVAVAVASPATTYAHDVVEGRIVAGPYVRAACARHLRDLDRQDTPGFAYHFDEAEEAKVYQLAAFVNLAEDTPLVLQPFQQFIVGCLFGWLDAFSYRRFRTAYIEMGKGNGKTPLAAFVGLKGLILDGEVQAEVYSAAPTRFQANITLTDALNMAKASPALAKRLEITAHNIQFGQSFFRTVSSEGRSLSGPRPHFSLIDEIHEHPNNVVVQKMRAGMKRRKQPLVFEITNSGSDRRSICWEHHQHSVQVAQGLVEDETWFAYVCALDAGDDWHDERVWPKANPGLGVILTHQYLAEQVKEADTLPSSANLIQRLNFCIWTEQARRWLIMDLWDGCDPLPDEPEKALEGEICYVGLDLASRRDFTAAVYWFPEHKVALPRFWVPEDMTLRTEAEKGFIRTWADQGFITLTPGSVTDYDVVRAAILEDCRRYQVEEIPYDQWNATQLATQLANDGATVVPIPQKGAAMSEGAKEMEALVAAKALRHGGNPVLRWMASNVAARIDPDENLKLDRDASGDRIDGIVALVMAIARGMLYQGGTGGWIVR